MLKYAVTLLPPRCSPPALRWRRSAESDAVRRQGLFPDRSARRERPEQSRRHRSVLLRLPALRALPAIRRSAQEPTAGRRANSICCRPCSSRAGNRSRARSIPPNRWASSTRRIRRCSMRSIAITSRCAPIDDLANLFYANYGANPGKFRFDCDLVRRRRRTRARQRARARLSGRRHADADHRRQIPRRRQQRERRRLSAKW